MYTLYIFYPDILCVDVFVYHNCFFWVLDIYKKFKMPKFGKYKSLAEMIKATVDQIEGYKPDTLVLDSSDISQNLRKLLKSFKTMITIAIKTKLIKSDIWKPAIKPIESSYYWRNMILVWYFQSEYVFIFQKNVFFDVFFYISSFPNINKNYNIHKNEDQEIGWSDKYRVAANITEYHIIKR